MACLRADGKEPESKDALQMSVIRPQTSGSSLRREVGIMSAEQLLPDAMLRRCLWISEGVAGSSSKRMVDAENEGSVSSEAVYEGTA